MADLKAMCEAEGFERVQTYIASGNVVFEAAGTEQQVQAALAQRLSRYTGKPVGVLLRSARELAQVLAANPFPESPGSQTVAIFLDAAPATDTLSQLRDLGDERLQLGRREIYVAYGSGMGQSRLKIPAAAQGTVRNINTIARLVAMAGAM